jgi:hypothetical protein
MNPEPPPLPPSLTPPPLLTPATPPPLPKRTRWGLIISIFLLGCFAVFAAAGIWVFSALKDFREARKPRPFLVEAPAYETLLGEDLSGSGFHFKHGDALYIGVTKHQFDGEAPKVMGSMEFDEPIKVTGVKRKQDDVQVLTFDSAKLSAIPPLPYDPTAKIDPGLPVYMYSDEGVVKGHVTFAAKASDRIRIRAEKPFTAMGCSGTPVVSGETGTVIAVLTDADDPDKARRIGAERLVMPVAGVLP